MTSLGAGSRIAASSRSSIETPPRSSLAAGAPRSSGRATGPSSERCFRNTTPRFVVSDMRASGQPLTKGVPGFFSYDGYHKVFNKAAGQVTSQLAQGTAARPIYVLLDALDQIDTADSAAWGALQDVVPSTGMANDDEILSSRRQIVKPVPGRFMWDARGLSIVAFGCDPSEEV